MEKRLAANLLVYFHTGIQKQIPKFVFESIICNSEIDAHSRPAVGR